MPTTSPPATNQETWRDWMPDGAPDPDQLYTRDEIIEMVDRLHVTGTDPVSAGDLRYWESLGILPRPVRRWHEGAARALYPSWYAYLPRRVRILQRTGYSLDEIRPRIRTHARLLLGHGSNALEALADGAEDVRLWPDLVSGLERIARWRAHLTGVETERVEVRVIGKDGRSTVYPLPISPSDEETVTQS
ncbi:MAG: hypothetical protein M3R02_24120 [Chloroflexota bacterium]|nr:hypothetical protein [Chloroflexota bacterium]